MSDLVSRQNAIEEINKLSDLICRQDAIDAADCYDIYMADDSDFYPESATDVFLKIINSLPSKDRPTGEWTDDMKCTNCGFQDDDFGIKQVMKCTFCPNCGARMEIK